MSQEISVVKGLQQFFSEGKHGRKIEIAEFKLLTTKDKQELREMLITEGYTIAPLKDAAA